MNFTHTLSFCFFPLLLNNFIVLLLRNNLKIKRFFYIFSWCISLLIIIHNYSHFSSSSFFNNFLDSFSKIPFQVRVFSCLHIIAFITTIYALFSLPPQPLLFLHLFLIQISLFFSFLTLIFDNIFSIGYGFLFNSILTLFSLKNSKNRPSYLMFQLQIIADLCIIIGLFLFSQINQSLSIQSFEKIDCETLSQIMPFWHFLAGGITLAGILIKLAQIPFYKWFLEATPYPIYFHTFFHQGTLLTTGVFLLFRMTSYYSQFKGYHSILLLISGIGLIFFNLKAALHHNIHKIIDLFSLGTISLILFLYSLRFYEIARYAALVHLFIRTCFSLLTGLITQIMSQENDLTKMGGLWTKTPFTFTLFLFTALLSVIFLFWIDQSTYSLMSLLNHHKIIILCIYSSFFIIYFFALMRLICLIFFKANHSHEQVIAHIKEVSWPLLIPIISNILCIFIAFFYLSLLSPFLSPSFFSNLTTQKFFEIKFFKINLWGFCLLSVFFFFHLWPSLLKSKKTFFKPTFLTQDIKTPYIQAYLQFFTGIKNTLENVYLKTIDLYEPYYKKITFYFFEKLYTDQLPLLLIILIILIIFILYFTMLPSILL